MRLDLRFTLRSLGELWCQAILIPVFSDSSEDNRGISGLDTKTGGYLSLLRKKGFWAGQRGEVLLIASEGMIKAEKILLIGLGVRGAFSPEVLSEGMKKAGDAFVKMGISDMGVTLPAFGEMPDKQAFLVHGALTKLVEAYLLRSPGDPQPLLKVVVSLDRKSMDAMESLSGMTKSYRDMGLQYTVIFEKELK